MNNLTIANSVPGIDSVTKSLEVTLGPDTGDLALRIGIHSGPVTAGVLRGERARFQLFGDTMSEWAHADFRKHFPESLSILSSF